MRARTLPGEIRAGRSWVGLAPFFKGVALYFAVGAHWGPDKGDSAGGIGGAGGAALAKCAPILALATFVWLRRSAEGAETSERRRVAAALCWSAAGDALLVWPQYFLAGMGAFAAAHLCYVWAAPAAATRPLLAAVLYASTAFTVKHFYLHGK
ncbi:Lysoplasmalogenase [Eumeta japonica]|uniref:lysoplasmalogenase n=1 Tax=Eumeta variegata TaxID=151549 RepID=A0A4C1Z6M2_EUMVA|nr:Lysoplasmalogenase [Eumeta japonica]